MDPKNKSRRDILIILERTDLLVIKYSIICKIKTYNRSVIITVANRMSYQSHTFLNLRRQQFLF